MTQKATTTTPDPELYLPETDKDGIPITLGGENPRGEVAGCPTGMSTSEQADLAQQPGGGGAPGTGAQPAPGKGVTEEQMGRSGRRD